MDSRGPLGTEEKTGFVGRRAGAALAIASAPVIAATLGHATWQLAGQFDPRVATVADAIVIAAAALGALVAGLLAALALGIALTPARSRARRVVERATPLAWRRVIAAAAGASVAAGIALPAAATPMEPASSARSGLEAPPSAGWIDEESGDGSAPPSDHAGWLAPPEPSPVTDRGSPPQDPAGAAHTVVPGDTLWDITAHHHGDGGAWPELYEFNRRVIGDDPDLIHPDQVLDLPAGWSR